ncbi:MAG TPA: hypothetical protein ENN79_08420 [Desulfobacteraceae bacterium]|nr:hypothetical protein [Desulfobacteraceae bacterium]
MVLAHEATSSQTPTSYRDLPDGYRLLTPVGDYAEEAAFYRRLFEAHCRRASPFTSFLNFPVRPFLR